MKFILVALSLIISTSSFATKVVVKELDNNSKTIAVALANRFDAPLSVNGPCASVEYKVTSTVEGFDAPVYAVKTKVDDVNLSVAVTTEDDAKMIAMLLDLVGVPGNRTGYTTFAKELLVKSTVCGFSPAYWTGSYEIFGPDWK